jgi:DNA-binding NarL/FixJ family response regulator
MTTVVLADDQELVRSGLASVLRVRGVEVVGEAADGAEAIEVVHRTRPDVVLMDVRMPVLDGIGATREIVRRGLGAKVLVVTTYDLDVYVYEALRAGACGFLLKATTPDRLVEGVKTVARGEALLAPSLTRRLIEAHVQRPAPVRGVPAALSQLTERELDVVRLVAGGRTNAEIAAALVVSQATVKTHVNRIFAKLALESRVQLVVLAYESGFVVPGAVSQLDG